MEISKKAVRLPWFLSSTQGELKVNSSIWMGVIIEILTNSSVNPETLKGSQRLRGVNPECVTMGKRNRVTFTCSYTKLKIAIERVKSQMSEKNEFKFSKKKKEKENQFHRTYRYSILYTRKKYSVN